MDIGKGAASDAKYLIQPKIGSPDVAGDLIDVIITNPSGARSIMMEDIELIANIKIEQDRRNVTAYLVQQIDNPDTTAYFNDIFTPYFMTNNIPNNDVQMPALSRNRNG